MAFIVKNDINGVDILFDMSEYIVKDKRGNIICTFSYLDKYQANIKAPVDAVLLDKILKFMGEYTEPLRTNMEQLEKTDRMTNRTEFFPWENKPDDIPPADEVWKSYKKNIVDKKTEMFLEVLNNFAAEAKEECFVPTEENPVQYPMIDINIIKK